jgi:hypothetical protein
LITSPKSWTAFREHDHFHRNLCNPDDPLREAVAQALGASISPPRSRGDNGVSDGDVPKVDVADAERYVRRMLQINIVAAMVIAPAVTVVVVVSNL